MVTISPPPSPPFKRKHLVTNWLQSNHSLFATFDSFVKTIETKGSVFRCEQSTSWLETELPVPEQENPVGGPSTPKTPDQVIPRKPSQILQVEVNIKELCCLLSIVEELIFAGKKPQKVVI
jgi:hypothetical protein